VGVVALLNGVMNDKNLALLFLCFYSTYSQRIKCIWFVIQRDRDLFHHFKKYNRKYNHAIPS
jgi:hypothetical protein